MKLADNQHPIDMKSWGIFSDEIGQVIAPVIEAAIAEQMEEHGFLDAYIERKDDGLFVLNVDIEGFTDWDHPITFVQNLDEILIEITEPYMPLREEDKEDARDMANSFRRLAQIANELAEKLGG